MDKTYIHPKAIRRELVEAMRHGVYAQTDRLPPETELAETLGISRTQLRDVLAVLEQEGFITRLHGVGTVINRCVVDIPVRMDIETEFLDMIRDSGFTPALAFVRAQEQPADPDTALHLSLPPGTPMLRIDRLCTADGRPAIYCEDTVQLSRVTPGYPPEALEQPIFSFLLEQCRISPYMDLTDLRPVCADDKLSGIFGIPVGTPLLCMREVDYDVVGNPVFFSLQYFADGFFRHTVLRKKL